MNRLLSGLAGIFAELRGGNKAMLVPARWNDVVTAAEWVPIGNQACRQSRMGRDLIKTLCQPYTPTI
jgi:hypothetical protein